MNLKDLGKCFPPEDIEWRIQSAGVTNGRTWAMVLAYITSRAIMDRLDEVCGSERWSIRFEDWQNGKGAKCTIGIKIGDEWVYKEDGAENTDIEPVKGGFSGAAKRAGVHWRIGRYLYNLESAWANIHEKGKYKGEAKNKANNTSVYFKWDPPELPDWALPEGTKKPTGAPQRKQGEPSAQLGDIDESPPKRGVESSMGKVTKGQSKPILIKVTNDLFYRCHALGVDGEGVFEIAGVKTVTDLSKLNLNEVFEQVVEAVNKGPK